MSKLLGLGYLGICFWLLPFAVDMKLPEAFELPKTALFVIVTLLTLGILGLLRAEFWKKNTLSLVDWFVVGFLIIAVISNVLNNGGTKSWIGMVYRYQGWAGYLMFGLFVVLVKYFSRLLSVKRMAVLVFGSSLLVALLVWQQMIVKRMGLSVYEVDGYIAALSGNPNFAAGVVALGYPMGWVVLGGYNFVLLPLFLGAIVWCGSRSALLALMIISLAYILGKVKSKLGGILLITIIVLSGIIYFPQKAISQYDRREIIWDKALLAWEHKPLFGWGLENFESGFEVSLTNNDHDLRNIRVDKAHNLILNFMVETGILGTLSIIGITLTSLLVLWRAKADQYYYCLLSTLVGYLIISGLNVTNINENLFFWLAVGTASGLLTREYISKL